VTGLTNDYRRAGRPRSRLTARNERVSRHLVDIGLHSDLGVPGSPREHAEFAMCC